LIFTLLAARIEPIKIIGKAKIIPAVKGSARIKIPRTTATAGFM
jgi:hypothetical protein